MSFRLTDEQIAREVAGNLSACARLGGFERDEAGWDEIWQGLYAILAGRKEGVRRAFGLDPRKSVLFAEFPDLLWAACDPQQPILYAPVFREFGYPVFDGGPSVTTMRFDPWTGRALPASVGRRGRLARRRARRAAPEVQQRSLVDRERALRRNEHTDPHARAARRLTMPPSEEAELRKRLLQYPGIDETNVDQYLLAYDERERMKQGLIERGMSNALAERFLDRSGFPRPPGWASVIFYPGSRRPRLWVIMICALFTVLAVYSLQ